MAQTIRGGGASLAAEGPLDVLVIGGGVNGCSIARDAAGRGLKVALAEQDDLASWTSSASTKLIHGGLRYLEQYAFRLVRESLQERERLLRVAPHLIHPLRFVLPHHPDLRPAWLIRAGLLLYDHLGGRGSLPRSRALRLAGSPEGAPLQERYRRGFSYYDCSVDDSRLVVLTALDAARRGAYVWTRTRLVGARRAGPLWEAQLQARDGRSWRVTARTLVNAAGPWVASVLTGVLGVAPEERLRLVRGSHIAVPKLYGGDHAYIFQNGDGRVVFAIPWRSGLTLIGATDAPHGGDPAAATATAEEIAYLCAAASAYFRRPVTPADVVHSFAGVRALHDPVAGRKPSEVTRDYALSVQRFGGEPPVLSVYGGKITTCRRLAEHALEQLSRWLPTAGPAWTASAPLPGGELDAGPLAGAAAFSAFLTRQLARYAWAPPALTERMARAYGALMDDILAGARDLAGLGEHFGAGLFEAEVVWLVRHEWAQTAGDILWRRTRLGLAMPEEGRLRLEAWLAANAGTEAQG
ncbi:glycerol-3-phosphate dehydrogenase [Camelimonas abortus]|uniref:Glycerol-3-phosphate dehydrogenase n=1 Tax=Camelimonas abortus TaxID=1017184 RepID=A0ABV7LFT8_9HYPH